jgi:glyceraldehyde-3-phosphate dehydrogenase (ferredoxin)
MLILEIDVERQRASRVELDASGPIEAALALHKRRETWRLDPLSPEVPFVFGFGPFVGGRLFGVHRLVFVFKSPQTRTLHVSTMGGAAYKAMGMGAQAVSIVGRASRRTALLIASGEVQFVEFQPGGDAYETARRLYELHRDFFARNDARALVVGPAAFTTYNGAVVSVDVDARDGRLRPGAEDFAGRGGPGTALAQGHNVVAVVAGGPKRPLHDRVADAKALDEIFKARLGRPYRDALNEKTVKYRYDSRVGAGGTFGVNYPHYRDLLPLFGYKSIYMPREERRRHAELVLELFWRPFKAEQDKSREWYNCGEPCPVLCKKAWRGKKVDYEPFHAMGPFIGNYVFEEAVPLVDKVDRLGLDAIEMGHVIAWLFDAVHVGLLRPEEVGIGDVPAFDPAKFEPVGDSRRNAKLASELVDGFVSGATEALSLVARRGIRAAARELERRFSDRVRATGCRFRDLAVYAALGSEGYMTPNFYWAPGLVAPMYVLGRYWSNYTSTFMPPEDFAESAYRRAIAEMFVDNAGVCRFHRGWAEEALEDLYRLAGLKPPSPALYRELAYYAKLSGAEPLPWEGRRTRDLISTLASELGAREWRFAEYEDYYEWWMRFKSRLDQLVFSE